MRRIRVAEQALRLAAEPPHQSYVCRSCLAAANRQYHSTPAQQVDNISFFKRMQESIFGKKKSQKELDREKRRAKTEKDAKEGVDEAGQSSTEPRVVQVRGSPRGTVYQMASNINPNKDPDYIPATTWDGLEKVGGIEWIKKRADRGEEYTGFSAQQQRQLDNTQWLGLIHHIAVEVLTLQAAGRNVLEVSNAPPTNLHLTGKATGSKDESGAPRVQYGDSEDRQAILDAIPSSVDGERKAPTNFGKLFTETEVPLADFNLSDPMIKLAILKRTMQLTGKRIPDIAMTRASRILDIYSAFKQKEKPKKLRDEPRVKELSSLDLPNVKVFGSRRTPVHKEKQIGRWKVIEDELASRGLPVLGNRWVDAKEGKYLQRK